MGHGPEVHMHSNPQMCKYRKGANPKNFPEYVEAALFYYVI